MRRLSVAAIASVALGACCFSPVSEPDGGASPGGGTSSDSTATGSSGTNGSGSSSGGGTSGASGGRSSTTSQKPAAVMIVQDLSGSMCQPINAATPGGASCLATEGTVTANYCSNCFPGGGTCSDSVSCASQMQQAASAITSVLKALAPTTGQLNLGLVSFPATGDQCGAGSVQIPIGDAVTTIPKIAAFYETAAPSGGGPMAATLAMAATDPVLANPDPSVRKVILLVTNGWPNCASSTPCTTEPWSNGQVYGCASPAEVAATGVTASPPPGCTCSFGTCASGASAANCCPVESTSNAALYCLDDQNTASELAGLYASQNISTYVVALGLGYGGNGAVLTELAGAGRGSATPFSASAPAAIETLLSNL